MTHCPTSDDLQGLLADRLSRTEVEAVEAHVETCAGCQQALERLTSCADTSEGGEPTSTNKSGADFLRRVEQQRSTATQPTPVLDRMARLLSPLPKDGTAGPEPLPTVAGYEVVAELGRGGMGIVYQARDVTLGRLVAVKMMRPEVARLPTERQRFLREAQSMAALEHENLISIYQVGERDGLPFFIMPFLPGESLQSALRRDKQLPLDEVLRLGRQLAAGLGSAHGAGLIHRDIKPSNIWLYAPRDAAGSKSVVKILDFGLARPVELDSTLTQTGAIVGTPQYMSPEQASGEPLDHRTDLFSLGCVLYQMLTGQHPFHGVTLPALMRALSEHQPAPPILLRAETPEILSEIVLQLLAKNRENRPSSALAVEKRLEALVAGTPDPAPARLPNCPPATASFTLTETAEDLAQTRMFRIERPAVPVDPEVPLPVDVGFFRARLRTVGEPTDPIFCGCAAARLQVRLKGGASCDDPQFPTLPENCSARVEFGTGRSPSVRFEAKDSSSMLEGRAQVAFSLAREPGEPLRLALTLVPEWFTIQRPGGCLLDGAVKVVVNAILRKLMDQSVTRKFSLGESDAGTDRS